MIDHNNYVWMTKFIKKVEGGPRVGFDSAMRYKSYLKTVLIWADEIPLPQAHTLQPTLQKFLDTRRREQNGQLLSAGTRHKTLQVAHRFFMWAKTHLTTEFRGLPMDWIEDLTPGRRPEAAPTEHVYVSVEEIRQIASLDLAHHLPSWRDQAAAVMLFLSGARGGAFSTLSLETVDLNTLSIRQWPELGVDTKRGQAATTILLNISDLLDVVRRWDTFIRSQLPPTSMWYTPLISQWGEYKMSAERPGKNRVGNLNKGLRNIFEIAKLPYRSSHKFRHGNAVFGLQRSKDMADYQAVSRNLMHRNIRTTDEIYAGLAQQEQRERILSLSSKPSGFPSPDSDLYIHLQTVAPGDIPRAVSILVERLAK